MKEFITDESLMKPSIRR